MQETRERILNYLLAHPRSAAADISRYLEMTPANIRYHLGLLESDGWVQVSGTRSGGGAGRPILLYNLRSGKLGDNLVHLLGALLTHAENSSDPDRGLQTLVDLMVADHFSESTNRVQRFNQAVDFLNNHQYRASWTASAEGPRVELRHCPYQDLAQTHPLLCQLDEKLLKTCFQTDLVLVKKRTFGKNPFSPCIFQAGEKGKINFS